MSTSLEVLNTTGSASAELGNGAAAPGDNAIAIGAVQGDPVTGEVTDGAFAVGDRSCQIGTGVNSTDDSLQFQDKQVPLEDRWNALIAYLSNGIKAIGTLLISGVAAEKFKTTTTAYYLISGVQYSKAATDNLTFTLAHVVTALKHGIILVQINAAGTVSTKVPAATQAYDTAALALAALPAVDAGNVALGYITIEADAGDWTANTDDMTDGSDLTAATFNDATPATAPTAL